MRKEHYNVPEEFEDEVGEDYCGYTETHYVGGWLPEVFTYEVEFGWRQRHLGPHRWRSGRNFEIEEGDSLFSFSDVPSPETTYDEFVGGFIRTVHPSMNPLHYRRYSGGRGSQRGYDNIHIYYNSRHIHSHFPRQEGYRSAWYHLLMESNEDVVL